MKQALPATIGRLFWDADPKRLDIETHQRTIVERVLNLGTLADWHWLVSVYGAKVVREAVFAKGRLRASGVRPESARLVELLVA